MIIPQVPAVLLALTALVSISTAYYVFRDDLADIELFLSNDLNRSGLAAVSDYVSKANKDGEVVKKGLDVGIRELKKVQGAVSAQAVQG